MSNLPNNVIGQCTAITNKGHQCKRDRDMLVAYLGATVCLQHHRVGCHPNSQKIKDYGAEMLKKKMKENNISVDES